MDWEWQNLPENRPRPAPWLIAALKKRAQVDPPTVTEEKDVQLFDNPEQLESESAECGT